MSIWKDLANSVLEAIDKQRQNSIKAMIEGLHNLLIELRDGKKGCSFACGSMLLGSLIKSMHSNNLLSDLSLCPQTPFPGLSFVGTAAGIRLIQSPSWDECLSNHRSSVVTTFGISGAYGNSNVLGGFGAPNAFGNNNNYCSQFRECKLEDLIKPILDRVGSTMTGLKL
jgi:hypothetical protein